MRILILYLGDFFSPPITIFFLLQNLVKAWSAHICLLYERDQSFYSLADAFLPLAEQWCCWKQHEAFLPPCSHVPSASKHLQNSSFRIVKDSFVAGVFCSPLLEEWHNFKCLVSWSRLLGVLKEESRGMVKSFLFNLLISLGCGPWGSKSCKGRGILIVWWIFWGVCLFDFGFFLLGWFWKTKHKTTVSCMLKRLEVILEGKTKMEGHDDTCLY